MRIRHFNSLAAIVQYIYSSILTTNTIAIQNTFTSPIRRISSSQTMGITLHILNPLVTVSLYTSLFPARTHFRPTYFCLETQEYNIVNVYVCVSSGKRASNSVPTGQQKHRTNAWNRIKLTDRTVTVIGLCFLT
jgi:hypothetical protein